MRTIPRPELDALARTLMEATGAAYEGEPGDGYAMLLGGLACARKALEGGETWAPRLVARWESALGEFAARWGIVRA
jgi:hypothetical protein